MGRSRPYRQLYLLPDLEEVHQQRRHNNDRDRIARAFRELRKKGYECHADWHCCQNCGLAALKPESERYVFFHRQDAVKIDRWGNLQPGGIGLNWAGDPEEIVVALREQGLVADASGGWARRIHIVRRADITDPSKSSPPTS